MSYWSRVDFWPKNDSLIGLESDFLAKNDSRIGLESDFLAKNDSRIGLELDFSANNFGYWSRIGLTKIPNADLWRIHIYSRVK